MNEARKQSSITSSPKQVKVGTNTTGLWQSLNPSKLDCNERLHPGSTTTGAQRAMTVDWKPSLFVEKPQKTINPVLPRKRITSARYRATCVALSCIDNPADQDCLLLKRQTKSAVSEIRVKAKQVKLRDIQNGAMEKRTCAHNLFLKLEFKLAKSQSIEVS